MNKGVKSQLQLKWQCACKALKMHFITLQIQHDEKNEIFDEIEKRYFFCSTDSHSLQKVKQLQVNQLQVALIVSAA